MKLSIIYIFFVLLSLQSYAQDSCYNCKLDSLNSLLIKTTDDNEKIRLLTLLSDLRIGTSVVENDSVESGYIKSLIALSNTHTIKDIDAYKSLLVAFEYYKKKDYINSQAAFLKTIALFDKTHKKIPRVLTTTRVTYADIGNWEARFQYYSAKLRYYLVNGPVENAAACYHCLAGYYIKKADFNLGISNYLRAADIYKKVDRRLYGNLLDVVGNTYVFWGNYDKALEYFNIAIPIVKNSKDSGSICFVYINLSNVYRKLNNYGQSMLYADSAYAFDPKETAGFTAEVYLEKAFSFIGLNNLTDALYNLDKANKIADSASLKLSAGYGIVEIDYGYYQYYSALKKYDKAEKYLLKAYEKAIETKANGLQLKYLKELADFYGEHNKPETAFQFSKKYIDLTDQLDKEKTAFKVAQYENEKKELDQHDSLNVLMQRGVVQNATIKKNNLLLWGSLVAIILISVSLFFVYRQYHMNKKTLLSLRKTQRQLIMAEKMASLGELTAGIAHEIQNPLNFVNNFSEVNSELIGEMKEELSKGNIEEAKTIANDINENEQKIIFHGKRADAIVKGMLQHSRSSSGVKEPTDINALADEYLRLAYHGLRAKDKSFNATMKTDFDPTIGNINIIPQDIGRVILNLITNAFYAVTEKKTQGSAGDDYEPTVTVSTKMFTAPLGGRGVLIAVTDNGNGIPKNALDKIFQPFFTTKPTGQGTGLGLSMSYDIVTQGHGGKLTVTTTEGTGTEFTINLPV